MSRASDYESYSRAIANEPLPLALVDLDALDSNVDAVCRAVRARGKSLRLASKSVRCLPLIRYITERSEGVVHGIMSYAVREAAFLAGHGFDDLLVAYPTMQRADLRLLASLNAGGASSPGRVAIVADCEDHVAMLEEAAAAQNATIPVVVDVDLSHRPFGGAIHLGVRRSPIHDAAGAVSLAELIARSPHLAMVGVMGYEAQIAGVTDANPFSPLLDGPKRAMKELSRTHVEELRQDIARRLRVRGLPCPIFNGGGSGSLAWCVSEAALTEVTVGSAFLDSHLFDYYRDVHFQPAAFFALEIVRRPASDIVTCHGGGYIASGEAGRDRAPVPWLPEGAKLLPMEGAGEVQTPVRLSDGVSAKVGDPFFFRHAKAGELAEHFNEYLLIRGDHIEGRAPTYRGMGRCFLG